MNSILELLQSGFLTFGPFIILLGLLIFVHELGHFAVAKYFGVRVETFSLGFGKKILKYKKGDTTYCLSLIPLGGYVKMFGDDSSAQVSEEDKKYSYLHKPVSQRIGVVLAGPLMNFFFAILVFFIVAMNGEDVRAPLVGDVPEASEAYQMGFRSGDLIVAVGGEKVKTWDDFQNLITKKHSQTLAISVQRDGLAQPVDVQAQVKLIDNPNLLSMTSRIGDVPGLSTNASASVIGVKPDSIAEKAGLKTGDIVTAVNGKQVTYFRDLKPLFESQSGQKVTVSINRYPTLDSKKPQQLTAELAPQKVSSLESLGVESSELYLARVLDQSPAAVAGLLPGDRIVSIGEKPVRQWDDILETVKSYDGKEPLSFTIFRREGVKKFDIQPQMTSQMTPQGAEEKRFTVGIVPWIDLAPPKLITVKAENVFQAVGQGVSRTWDITAMTVMSFVKLVQNKISPKNIGGVISIGQAASETFKMGLTYFLNLMAVISVNLFILNLLPIPVLDGGHLVIYLLESIKGSPVSIKKLEIAQQIGFVVLMGLMVLALFNDVTRLFHN